MSNLSKIFIWVGAVVLLVIAGVFAYLKFYPAATQNFGITVTTPPQNEISFTLKPAITTIKTGDKIEVPVYLSGGSAGQVSAIDVKFDFDSSILKLTDATAGAFFVNPLKVSWDTKSGAFTFSKGLDSTAAADASSPIITLTFTALKGPSATNISTDASSSAYISESGAVSPIPADVNISIQ